MNKLVRLSSVAIIIFLVLSLFSSPILTRANRVFAQDESPTQPTQLALDESPTPTPTLEPQPTPTAEPTLTPTLEPTLEPTALPTEGITFEPTSTPEESTPVVPGFQWSIRINGKSHGPSSKAIETLNSLKSQGIIGDFTNNKLKLSGSKDIKQMKDTIFEGLPEGFDFLGGPVSLLITYTAEAGKEMVIRLESRPATGYGWVLLPSSEFDFTQSGQSEVHTRSKGMGVPSIQTMRFTPNFSGTGTLHLAYQRAFESVQSPDAELQLTLADQPAELDLSDPIPFVVSDESAAYAGEGSATGFDANLVTTEPLPATFDWRTYGVVPSVRNQGACGSCWAFGTVGIMESAIKIGGGALADLSEQFLISCNNDGWSCNGGLTATKYHFNTIAKNQASIGAVLESDKPYTATNGSCSIISNHPYKASDWTFVSGYEWKMPTVDQIKSAIYTYGPVTARVCSGSGWYSYSGGVFSTEESASACSGSVNHQIILVGWNDANQTWILRNSWGSSWGDGGYMYIRWNTSRVGEGTSWVKYGDSSIVPTAPALVAPSSGTLTNEQIMTISWSTVPFASKFDVQVDNNSDFTSPESTGTSLTTTSFTTAALPDAKYFWRVRAKNVAGQVGAWSPARDFTIAFNPPAPPVLSSPATGAEIVGIPTFTWLASVSAVSYQLQYETTIDHNPDTYIFRSPELTALTFKPASSPELMLPVYWSVRAKDNRGYWGAWSEPFSVTVVPPAPGTPVLGSPNSGAIFSNNAPTLSWTTSSYANTWEIQVDDSYLFTLPLVQEHSSIAELTHAIDTLPDGKYYWHVRANNLNNTAGPWSAYRYFTVDATPPAIPSLSKPLNGSQSIGTPTFTWQASITAAYYQVQYETTIDGNPDTFTFRSPEINALTYKPATTPELMLPIYWSVRAKDALGNWSAWSAPYTVTVVPPVPAAPILSNPASGVLTNNPAPTLAWNTVAYANTWEIQIDTTYTFLAPLVQEHTGITELNHVIDSLPDGKYYWHVRARNLNDKPGPWSIYRYFTIDTIKPIAPVLSKPLNGSQSIGTPTFSWLASASAIRYQVQYEEIDDNNPDTFDYRSPELTTLTHKPAVTLPFMTTFYWQVRARDAAGNWSNWSVPFTVTVVPPVPAAPILNTPASGLATNDTTPDLFWKSVAYANTYDIQIDTSYTFPAPMVQEFVGVSGLSQTINSLPDGNYYWHVRARNLNDKPGPWSAYRYFTVDTSAPLAPGLSKPANNTNFTGTPTFTWLASVGAKYYQVRYDDESAFSDPVSYTSPVLTVLSHKPAVIMPLMVSTYWQVRAGDAAGNWSAWSAPFSITVFPPTPAAPTLSYPASASVSNNNSPDLSWKSVTYAGTYEIQVDTTYTFPAPMVQEVVGITGLNRIIASLPDGKYYWHVRARNMNNVAGPWSAYRYFTIDTKAPVAPVLSQPSDNASVIQLTPTFSWLTSSTANAYQFQYSAEPGFSDPVTYTSGTLTVLNHKPGVSMAIGTWYWRVRARDSVGNWGAWSACKTLKILP